MSDPTDIFTSNTEGSVAKPTEPAQPSSASPEQQYQDLLAGIRNERGEQKYTDIPKALDGLKNAQEYIPQLKSQLDERERELTELRALSAKQTALEDVISKLGTSQAKPNTTDASLDEQKATALFEQLLNQRSAKETADANQRAVSDKLVETFGSPEAAKNAIASKAAELGSTAEEIGQLSARNPRMVLELFKTVQAGKPPPAPPKTTVNTDAFLNQAPKEGGLQPPTKSLLSGATFKEQAAYLRQIKADVYKRHGISET